MKRNILGWTLQLLVAVVFTILGIQIGYVYGFQKAWDSFECRDVTDPDEWVAAHERQ